MILNGHSPIFAICFAVASIAPAQAAAQNFWRGQWLYTNHCDACHDSVNYPGRDRKVKSSDELRKRIASWAEHTGQNWGNREIEDVLYYLDKSYYHFGDKQPLPSAP